MTETTQNHLNMQVPGSVESVENYQFEPIKGYPMLQWHGKRPFTSTQYYPAQHKETHGPEVNGWRNKIYWGDNLQVMSHLLKEYRGQVKLVYIDPPFDSKAEYKKKIAFGGKSVENNHNTFEEKQYADIWTNDEFLQFIYERLIVLRELLTEDGSVWLHCDWHKMHLLRSILDEVFGPNNFINEIVWKSQSPSGMKALANQFSYCHESLFWYAKSSERVYNKQFMPYSQEYIEKRFRGKDKIGRYKDYELQDPSKESLEKLKQEDRLVVTKSGKQRVKQYLHESPGVLIDSVWMDISAVNSQAYERENYPTQKPEALLDRIIKATSNLGDIVLDCFMGSGTTQAVAMKLGRRFIGADINLGAVQITTKRLLQVASELQTQPPQLKLEGNEPIAYYTGFEIYNVNHYDVFRNPVEAKDLLIEALEIHKLEAGHLYDGEKDGRLWKIMPVNRIATRQDLNDLIANLDYRTFERRQTAAPNQPVEKITLVCMGHEPGLDAALKQEVAPFKLDVEVVDILRDRQDIQFKRDSEARIVVKGGKLVIEAFYPMNLLSKLSLQKERVDDWRELVESVMIDFNYDGAILEPMIVDIPNKNDLVNGVYPIPASAGTIRVKITDILSESLEQEVSYG